MPARAERMVVRLGTLHGYPFSPPAADWMLSWHSSGDAPMDTPVAVVAAAEVCVCACVVVAVVVVVVVVAVAVAVVSAAVPTMQGCGSSCTVWGGGASRWAERAGTG
jgi:hypothetical protein